MTARTRRLLAMAPALTLAAAVFPSVASAQSSSNQAAAEALFKQGRDLMAAGQYSIACPKFAESQRLDPAPGTMLNLATCYEKNGQIASAWVTFKEAATASRNADQPERARLARDKAAEIEPTLPMLTIVVPPAADRPDLQVRRDGEIVGRPEWGTPIPIDPGTHVVEASGPGLKAWQGSAAVPGPSAKISIEVPVLEPTPAEPPPPAAQLPAPTLAPAAPPQAADEAVPGSAPRAAAGTGQRTAAWVVGSVGLAGIVAGAISGGIALSEKSVAANGCVQDVCSPSAYDSVQSAKGAATISDVAFAVGGALVVTGLVVYLTTPRRPTMALSLAPVPFGRGGAGGLLQASF